jgi:hypothetical protein
MSYIINNSRGNIVAVVADGTVNTTATPITLVGRGVTSYGTSENENYVWILENFANSTAPLNPILGQLWYDNSVDTLNVYNSTSTWTAIASQDYVQAQKFSPTFTGTPTAPTPVDGTNNTQLATTRFVGNAISNFASTASVIYAPLISPSLSGTPTSPTASAASSTNQIATTAFVQAQKDNPVFTGNISTTGNVSATGNIIGANFVGNVISPAGSEVNTTGNIVGGNINTGGVISATGNITGANVNTGQLSLTSNVISAINTVFGITTTANVVGGNVLTTGIVSAGGNISTSNTVFADTVIANTVITNGTTSAFRLPNLTQTQIDALSPQNGDMVYNTTTDYPQVFQTGAWRIFTLSYYS